MGRTVYLPIHEWLILMVNVSEYTSPMDPIGGWKILFFFFYRRSGTLPVWKGKPKTVIVEVVFVTRSTLSLM